MTSSTTKPNTRPPLEVLKHRILLYTEEPIAAMGLERVLAPTGEFHLECFSSMADLLSRMEPDRPSVVVLDISQEMLPAALADLKGSISNCSVVLWVNGIATELAFQAMGMGVRGILRKSLPAELQIKCLRKVGDGELWFEKALTDRFLGAERVALSPREGQLVTLLSQGLKNREIAHSLQITEGTVKVYLSRLYTKLGVKDRFELALFGLKNQAGGPAPIAENALGEPVIPGLRSMMLERMCPPRGLAAR